MRIALIAPLVSPIAQPYIGGSQALLADLAQELHRRGHQVTLFARTGSYVEGVKIETIAVPASVQPATFSRSKAHGNAESSFFTQAHLFLELFLQLRQRCSAFDLLHVHAFDWPAYICSALVRELPVLHTIHLPAVSVEINEALHILDQQGHPLALATVSRSCARTYANYTSIDHVIYNGLDIAALPFQAAVAKNAPLLCAGRIAPEKGVEAAIEIAERARSPLVIAGGIYDQAYYEHAIAPHLARPGSRITYIGQIEREALWELMSRAAALLCPIAWDEPFGLAPVEAMATGTPVIAFRRGSMEEIILHGETGFLVEPGECAQAAALLDDLGDIPRARCRSHVEENFTLDTMVTAYEQVYRGML
ncbi:MAG TPA: glycosyltransferase family 4 protein [Ktedonobacteraceae bacterium]|jgi:glycosyltransferase involved in cell wall biosynthesis